VWLCKYPSSLSTFTASQLWKATVLRPITKATYQQIHNQSLLANISNNSDFMALATILTPAGVDCLLLFVLCLLSGIRWDGDLQRQAACPWDMDMNLGIREELDITS
jgi:hypothetical protein